MADSPLVPQLYLLNTCPFCLKLRIFLTEAGLAGGIRFTVFEQDDETHRALRARMESADQKPSFPAAELSAGALTTGTDQLIAHFADQAGVDPAALPLLAYYSDGVFRKYVEMFGELRTLKAAPAS